MFKIDFIFLLGDSLRTENSNAGNATTMTFSQINNNPQTFVQQNILFQQAYMNYMAHFSQMYLYVLYVHCMIVRFFLYFQWHKAFIITNILL